MTEPKLILADEPTAALDRKSGREVVELMQGLAREQGCTILLVTHDDRILDIAHRIIHMEDGRLKKTKVLKQSLCLEFLPRHQACPPFDRALLGHPEIHPSALLRLKMMGIGAVSSGGASAFSGESLLEDFEKRICTIGDSGMGIQ